MKHLCGATTHFTFFAISHKQTAHDGSIFLPFVTLSPSTSCGSDPLPSAVCASHTRFHPAFLVCSKAQTSLPASLPQQPSRTGGVLRVTGSRGVGEVGTLQGCPDPWLLHVATSSPQPVRSEQGAECPPFPSGSELSATGACALAVPAGVEVERVSSWTLAAHVGGKGAGTNIPCRSRNPAVGAGVWESSRASAISWNPSRQRSVCWPCFVLHHNVQPLKMF